MKRLRQKRRRMARGWYVLLCAVLLYVFATAADRQLKRAPHPGYLPPGLAMTAYAPDLSYFWRQLQHLEGAQVISEALPKQVHQLELAVRQATGVRPTPARVRVWMGKQVLVGFEGDSWVACVKPGLLMRGAGLLLRLSGAPAKEEHIGQYGELHYAWRDGFLLFSPSLKLVRDALAAPPAQLQYQEVLQDAVRLDWRAEPAGRAMVRATSGLPVAGELAVSMPRRGGMFQLAGAIEEPLLLSVTAHHPQDIRRLAHAIAGPHLGGPGWNVAREWGARLWDAWQMPAAPGDWDASLEECAFACTRIELAGAVPVPEVVAVLRTDAGAPAHPLAWLLGDHYRFPYAWDETHGTIMPIWQQGLALCLAGGGPYWYAASRERAMDALLAGLGSEPFLGADLLVRVSWKPVGDAAARLLQKACELELITGTSPRDAEDHLIPYTYALSQLGRLEIRADFGPDTVRFSGVLMRNAASPEETAP